MPPTTNNTYIEDGKKAPAFKLNDQQGKLHQLSDYQGKWLVLYFYPKDNTPGCTQEACQFRDQLPDFEQLGAVIFGISPDNEAAHQRFVDKFGLPFSLLADPDHEMLEAYGVWREKKLYGRTYMGVMRTTYLIDPLGKVAKRWEKVKVKDHALAVHAELKKLIK